MRCPKCQADNPDTSLYCGNCATSLASAKAAPPSLTKTLASFVHAVTQGTVFAGRYEILGQIGAGGMGEVYRAIDKNLGRHIAIKILPSAFAEDKERMARFEREAKLLAVLNHTNIAAIYGLEESEGRRFLVLELVEGETLQARLNRGPLTVEEALEACRELAEGLEAAHEKGIIHRDLKPGNIMITSEGKVKILDFGLAKAFEGETTGVDIEKSPTITAQMTEPGVILGTAAYMSPEQARGRSVDKRSDIWAFGCILYECLTGSRTFQGETVSDTLAHILKGEPDWGKLPPDTPIRIRTLLRCCLEKNPRERLHDIADARIEIAGALSSPPGPEALPTSRPVRALIFRGVIGGLILVAATALITWHLKRAAPTPPVGRYTLKVEPGLWLDGMRSAAEPERPSRIAIAVANDGRFIVDSAILGNLGPPAKPQIYLRKMDQMGAAPVEGTDGGIAPFLSPDDRWIGFWDGGKLKKVPVAGGVAVTLCDAPLPFGADWGPDNKIIYSSDTRGGLFRIPSEGGKPENLTAPDKTRDEFSHRLPHCLPDGKTVVFTIAGHGWDLHPRLALLDLETKKWRVVIEDAADGRYIRTGHLVFLRQGVLMAVGFDLDRREPRGQPVPAVENVMQALNSLSASHYTAEGQCSISDSGLLAYVPGGIIPDSENSLVRVDLKGKVLPAADFKAPFFSPRFSPDGKRIAYCTAGMENFIWIYDLDRETRSRLTAEGLTSYAVWTPDGKRLAFDWLKTGLSDLYWQLVDGSSPREQLTTGGNLQFPATFIHNGETLIFVQENPETSYDILLLDMKGRRVTPFLNSKAAEGWPEVSRDGRWLAYVSDESGPREVWVQPFPGPGGRWQVSQGGGSEPIWSKDGRQIYYRQAAQVWVTDVSTGGEDFSAGRPRLLFEQQGFYSATPVRTWDLLPDGQGFLMVKLDERKPPPVTEIILVQNWFEELKRLVPSGKK